MSGFFDSLELSGPDSLDSPRAARAYHWIQWVLFGSSLLAIPAFYMELTASSPFLLNAGRILYLCMATGFAWSLGWMVHLSRRYRHLIWRNRFDVLVLVGAAASIGWGGNPWSSLEWLLRMTFMGMVALRIVMSLRRFLSPNRLLSLLMAGAALLALAGVGFYWLEPRVHSYADGLWLAFESSATVGYGDVSPTTPASRVFAVFVVLFGYGMLSLVFASIAAKFIGQEERLLRHEMHQDIKRLHEEMAVIHKELQGLRESMNTKWPPAPAGHLDE
ncbi:potassium channel family protein [Trinickia sp. LjRoot230]|uniref:potassium channel family protein n=1 Tax=Trinickia sp. LjRoot230 TaxID=3342288 RepID=UPI003ECE5BD5